MTTAGSLITKALGKLSVVTPSRKVRADELATGLVVLNDWLDEMRLPPFFAQQRTETVFTLPAGVTSRTIGLGMQINVLRPVRLEKSFVRIGTQDYPLEPIDDDEYQDIALKQEGGSWPRVMNFDGNETVFFYPVSGSGCEVHLFTLNSPGRFADVTTEYDLPPGYTNPIVNNLAVELAPNFEVVARDDVVRAARRGRNLIVTTNLTVPQLCARRNILDTKSAFLAG